MNNGLVRVAAASPDLRVANCDYNAAEIVKMAWRASAEYVRVLVTPELCITGYTCGDLFGQQLLIDAAEKALHKICTETSDLQLLLLVGLPVRHRGKLYNCAAVVSGGYVLGFVPKTHLPNYGEFYELRHFTPAFDGNEYIEAGPFQGTPIGTNLLFRCEQLPALTLGVEVCEDLWVPSPPSTRYATAGATLIANLSASDETVGKAEYRRALVSGQSARLVCGYMYADAAKGESTTDMVFSGQNLVAENGIVLSEAELFSSEMAVSEIDVDRILHERRRLSTFPAAQEFNYYAVPFSLDLIETPLSRSISPAPFIPANPVDLDSRCQTILDIQADGLCKRIAHVNAKTAVVGISGGLDSSLALIVAVEALRRLGRPAEDVAAITMPGFGTTDRTRGNAEKLCEALGVTLREVDITDTVRSHFTDIGHPEDRHDVVYENAQARVRTLVLMDIANQTGGLVIGTGDLSELALGWATYNGDHMSMYGVNASVPKTLIRHIIRYKADTTPELAEVLEDILNTPVSPELLPPADGVISQETESLVGPYELHDFFLYYVLRWGFSPTKVFRFAAEAFSEQYDRTTILKWLRIFFARFFSQQYKRSCLPDGPKVGSVSLSPRGDWRMPSDASAHLWMEELDQIEI